MDPALLQQITDATTAGAVQAIVVVLIAPVSSYVAPIGARLAHRLPRRWLEIGFGLFLLLAAARFLASLFY